MHISPYNFEASVVVVAAVAISEEKERIDWNRRVLQRQDGEVQNCMTVRKGFEP